MENEKQKLTNTDSNSATVASYTAKKKFSIGYRYITPSDYMTPLMHLPIQRMILEIENPFGKEQIKDAIIKAFDENWYDRRYLEIEDDFFAA